MPKLYKKAPRATRSSFHGLTANGGLGSIAADSTIHLRKLSPSFESPRPYVGIYSSVRIMACV